MDDVLISRVAVAKAIADLGKEFLDGGSPTAVKVLNIAADRINALTPSPDAYVAGLREAVDILDLGVELVNQDDLTETRCGDIENFYGGLFIKMEGGKPLWAIEDYSRTQWSPCPPAVFAALAAEYAVPRRDTP